MYPEAGTFFVTFLGGADIWLVFFLLEEETKSEICGYVVAVFYLSPPSWDKAKKKLCSCLAFRKVYDAYLQASILKQFRERRRFV